MLHFLKDKWKFIQIHQYYTMALKKTSGKTLYKLFIAITILKRAGPCFGVPLKAYIHLPPLVLESSISDAQKDQNSREI